MTVVFFLFKDCYILDQGGTKIFVWKGKKADKAEKQAAMTRALVKDSFMLTLPSLNDLWHIQCTSLFDLLLQEFIKTKDYHSSTNVETVNDGAESALFKQLFQTWTVKDQTQGLGKIHTKGKIGMWCLQIDWFLYFYLCLSLFLTLLSFLVAHISQEKFDASLMHVMPEIAAQERMVDNGTGQVEVTGHYTCRGHYTCSIQEANTATQSHWS